jgi:eukaryotic translation initiation factor 2C
VQTIGNSVYFNVPDSHELHVNLGGGAEAWAGYKQAVKPCQIGLSFNIDLAATAFMSSGPLPNVVANMLNMRGGVQDLARFFGQREHKTIKTALKGLRVRQNGAYSAGRM